MKRITIRRSFDGAEVVYATSASGHGLFFRLPHQGAYQQVGTGNEFFRGRTALLRRLRKMGVLRSSQDVIESWGW